MKNLKFGIKLLPFLLAGSMTVAVGVPAYENRPRKFDEITDCTSIDRVIYEKYEKISYEDFKKLLGEKNKEFLIEYKIVETGEENRTILDSDDILNEREYLAFHNFNRQNINLFEAIENGEIEIKGIHYIHHVVLEDDELKNFDIEDAYLRENLDDVFNIECLDRNGRATISGKVIFDRSKDGDITAKCSYKINRKNIFGKNIQPRTIKKCYKTIPKSENNDQCKYDDTSISSQVNLKNPRGRLKYLGSTTMTYDEMKKIDCDYYIIYSEEEVTKDELIQLLKDDNKTNFHLQFSYYYSNHPYDPKRYSTTKQDYLEGKSDDLNDLLQNPDVNFLNIKISSRQIVTELPSKKTDDSIDIIRNYYVLSCTPDADENYETKVLGIDSRATTQYESESQKVKKMSK